MHSGLNARPLFVPSVGHFAQGMVVSVPLQLWALPGSPKASEIRAALCDHYSGQRFVKVESSEQSEALVAQLDPESLNGTNEMKIYVFANEARGQAGLTAIFDNLGKGASGQAIQCLNLMLGIDENTGL